MSEVQLSWDTGAVIDLGKVLATGLNKVVITDSCFDDFKITVAKNELPWIVKGIQRFYNNVPDLGHELICIESIKIITKGPNGVIIDVSFGT